jgi:hypothetical protein
MKSPSKYVWFVLVSLTVALGACSTTATREGMTAVKTEPLAQVGQSVKVSTLAGGGADGSSDIADEDLKAVIESSIERTGVFKQVVQSGGSEYELTVRVVSIKKPLAGFSMTVDMETAWSLVRVSDRKAVLQKGIASTYTAGMGEAFSGMTRVRMAVEGAVRENIAQGLKAIAALKS